MIEFRKDRQEEKTIEDMMEKFSMIEGPRHSRYIAHKLADILTIVMCAVLSSLDRLGGIMVYQENNQVFLKKRIWDRVISF